MDKVNFEYQFVSIHSMVRGLKFYQDTCKVLGSSVLQSVGSLGSFTKALVNGLVRSSTRRQDYCLRYSWVVSFVRPAFRQKDLDFLPRHSGVAQFVLPPIGRKTQTFDQGTREWLGSSFPQQLGLKFFYQGTCKWLGSSVLPQVERISFFTKALVGGLVRPSTRGQETYIFMKVPMGGLVLPFKDLTHFRNEPIHIVLSNLSVST